MCLIGPQYKAQKEGAGERDCSREGESEKRRKADTEISGSNRLVLLPKRMQNDFVITVISGFEIRVLLAINVVFALMLARVAAAVAVDNNW